MFNKMKEVFNSVLNNSSTVIVNGKRYSGSGSVVITSNNTQHNVIIDGKIVSTEDGLQLTVNIEGSCGDIKTTNGNVNVNGNTQDITSTNGDINVTGSSQNVQTVNGDVRARNITGKVNTVNGDITV